MEIKQIKAAKITVKKFAPFGQYVSTGNKKADSKNKVFSFWDSLGSFKIKGETAVCIVNTLPQKQMREDGMEHHKKTAEALLATSGDIVVVTTLADDKNPKLPDPAKVKAFVVPKGDAVIFSPGVWHHAPLAVKEACNVFIIFDKSTLEKDFYYIDLEKQFGFNWEVTI
jgi:ureidoglycolate hydrolase